MFTIDNDKCWLKNDCNHCDCDKVCMRLVKLNYIYDEALMSLSQRAHRSLVPDKDGTDLEEFKQLSELTKNIVDFVEGGKSLYLHSTNCGNGKTSWALKFINSYFNAIWAKTELTCRGLFINVPTLLMELKSNISQKSNYVAHIKENINDADLVIWDDIATKQASQFDAENLLSMIEMRINNGKANIFTSNLNDKDLHNCLGDRLSSRIVGSTYNIELNGKDKRGI